MSAHLDYGAIGNGRLLGLIGPDSGLDWLCLPRFDSPSVFARILDDEKGGTFRVRAESGPVQGRWEYLKNTNVLRGEFALGDARWEVLDFAPRVLDGEHVDAPLELVRLVRPLAGAPRLAVEFDPRPDYAQVTPRILEAGDSLLVEPCHVPLRLVSSAPLAPIAAGRAFTLREPLALVLTIDPRRKAVSLPEAQHLLERTVTGWRAWARTLALPDFYDDAVIRSALVLALHAHLDTGSIIAAATTSIPEAIGTPRTWDYRYCWLRDAAFVVEALRRLAQVSIGERFVHFLREVAEGGPLQPLYGVAGERELPERTLPHLAGFAGTGPVRVGNAAALQQQNDLNGELVLGLESLLLDPRVVRDDLEVPVRVIYGERDWILPDIAQTVRRLQRDVPHAEVTALPECGHFLQEEHPEELARLLAAFFG
ncbi:MAG: trehalase-like domain-containing protein [Myxococcota bacterium]